MSIKKARKYKEYSYIRRYDNDSKLMFAWKSIEEYEKAYEQQQKRIKYLSTLQIKA